MRSLMSIICAVLLISTNILVVSAEDGLGRTVALSAGVGGDYEEPDNVLDRLQGVVVNNIKAEYWSLGYNMLNKLSDIADEYNVDAKPRVVANFTEGDIELFGYQLIAAVMVTQDIPINSGRVGYTVQNTILQYGGDILTVEQMGIIQETPWGRVDLVGTVKLMDIDTILTKWGYGQDIQAVKTTANNMYIEFLQTKAEKQKAISSLSLDLSFGGGIFNAPVWTNATWMAHITSGFGGRFIEGNDDNHTGLDIAAPEAAPIAVVKDGNVLAVKSSETGYGLHVYVQHDDCITLYAHCSDVYVTEGQPVMAGDTIAAVGSTGWSTGNHLHFEIHTNGIQIDPYDYIKQVEQ